MPSPFVRVGPANTSVEGMTDRPTPITPLEERYAGFNNPYRGTETHGVEPTERPTEPEDWADGRPVKYDEPKPPPDPVPVRIVSEGAKELRRFRTYGAMTGSQVDPPRSIVGQDEERNSVTVKHVVESAIVYVSHSAETCNAREGFPLASGDTWTTSAQSAIFAWADSAVALSVSVVIDYATKV